MTKRSNLRVGRIALVGVASLALASASQAQLQQVVWSTTVLGMAVPSVNPTAVTLPAFDPQVGVLRSVQVDLSAAVSGTLSFENTDSVATVAPNYYVGCYVRGSFPGGGFSPSPNPAFEFQPDPFHQVHLAAFDGTVDFSGPSGVVMSFTNATGTGSPSMSYPVFADSQLGAWIGLPGAPGTVVFTLTTLPLASGGLPATIVESHSVTANAALTVRYLYDTLPASICVASFFSGCPCMNPGFSGGGCGNSANNQGGRLMVSGSASLGNDTLQLLGSGMTNNFALYFQGTSFQHAQLLFGDGLRCVTGATARLGAKVNAGGSSAYPVAGDPPISVRGSVTAPGKRFYQVLYRDAVPGFCTSATFNLTNGYAIEWQP